MSIRRYRSLAVLVVALALPVTTQAQFGSLIKKAKALRTNVDSAKAVVDTTRTVVTATKSTAADVMTGTTGPATPPDSSAGSGGAAGGAGHGGRKGGAVGAGGTAGPGVATGSVAGTSSATPAPTQTRRAGTAATATRARPSAAKPAQATTPTPATSAPPTPITPATPAAGATPATRATPPKSGVAQLTETEYGQFAHGFAVEQARIKTNSDDMAGAITAGVAASGLTKVDYIVVRQKVMMYAPYAKANKTDQLTRLLSAQDMTVLNAHKSDIIQMVTP